MKKIYFFISVFLLASITFALGQTSVSIPELIIFKKSGIINKKYTPPPPNWNRSPQTSDIIVDYQGNWTVQAQAAFDFAVNLWEQGITSTVPVRIIAKFEPLGANIIGQTSSSGQAWANFAPGSGEIVTPNVFYPQALANKLAHSDLSPSLADFTITLSSNASSINFYYGTDGNVGTTQLDFVSTVLHEIAHGLAFWSSLRISNNQVLYMYNNGFPMIYDNFIRNSTNIRLTTLASPSTALTNFAQSDNLFFDGFNAIAGNGGTAPPLYSPNPFSPGSSISHLREASYPNPSTNRLMTPFLDYGEAIHDIGTVSHGIMSDLRWDMESWTGIEDYIQLITPIPLVLTQNQAYTYHAAFTDVFPYGAWMNTYNWKLDLLTNTEPITVATANTLNPLWAFTLPSLPALIDGYYSRNYDGTVRAKVKVYGNDNQGNYHEFVQDVSIYYLPDLPSLQKLSSSCYGITVSFFSRGATSYILYYGFTSGVPYTSSINVPSGTNEYTIPLPPVTNIVYVNVRGINQAGISMYGNEVQRTCVYKSDPVDIPTKEESSKIILYPNPASNFITISASGFTENFSMMIYASNGKMMFEKTSINTELYKLDISAYPCRIYLIKLINADGVSIEERFIKN
jgi:hypothetical protein